MARVTIAYAQASGRPTMDHPLGVVAQDEFGVAVERVDQDVFALAERLGVPPLTFAGWLQGAQARLEPYFIRTRTGIETVAVSDPRWLTRFVAPSLVDTVTYGPIHEEPGDAATVAKRIASRLASEIR